MSYHKKTTNNELVWGIHPVLELLRINPAQIKSIEVVSGKEGDKVQAIIDLARQHNIRIEKIPANKLPQSLGSVSHQGVLARIAPYPTIKIEQLLKKIKSAATPPILIALDLIQDPHNLGAIIRSASAAGAAGIIMTKDRAAPLNATAAKSSAGAIAHLDICMVTNLNQALKLLKDEGFWIYGAAGEAEQSLYDTDFSGPICLIIGGEKKGLRPLVREQCDFLLSIPMAGSLDSLNASVAAGVILFEAVRQRKSKS
ncbi:MAG: 23S rRNA (guanosine(2251)-2'-O)-methyltransferase RlmB [Desulfobulbaceae bacterium]|nr:23S rRNA (guanosine(2251)-2'-O)-methyltransferase RlmB [Desulfobulbaceae bacterium]HIJ78009.1 23S rRNA (guanosine(2251)-2'-O)-methyltransferase RlmB [Deltaproteobacteria bacterium]